MGETNPTPLWSNTRTKSKGSTNYSTCKKVYGPVNV